ncbi:MAG: hypothetical protein AB7D36_05510 [Oscillospiraceae bacterium]
MAKVIQYKGMKFKANANGTYTVSSDSGKYSSTEKTFHGATEWLWNMADNHDIGNEFCHRICRAFNCDVYGHSNTPPSILC